MEAKEWVSLAAHAFPSWWCCCGATRRPARAPSVTFARSSAAPSCSGWTERRPGVEPRAPQEQLSLEHW